ncbi:hypothetical protein TNCT_535181 [Trichonephila clavata]|uniref:Uncharacterized protein n=1 Tax=Trichonephila clavata TaxID=2740835 RepID=A0A8X6FQV7_TRICU|nr:hypothetical protein TNCT_535181 [Trichonephila clavata]
MDKESRARQQSKLLKSIRLEFKKKRRSISSKRRVHTTKLNSTYFGIRDAHNINISPNFLQSNSLINRFNHHFIPEEFYKSLSIAIQGLASVNLISLKNS